MSSMQEKIAELEEEIANTAYNKATQHHIGKLKAKLARLKEDLIKKSSKKGLEAGFSVKKEGHATVVIVGFPSAGKSTLLNKLTNANSPVGSYDFTTLNVIPGLMEYKNVKIQLLDVPGIIGGASSGKGRGKEVLAVARNADLILMLIDATKKDQLKQIKTELEGSGVRLDKKRPRVSVNRTQGGGVHLLSSLKLTRVDDEVARSVANTFGVHNAEISVNEDVSVDELVDVFQGNRVYVPAVTAINKIDLVGETEIRKLKEEAEDCVLISAEKDVNLDALREEVFRRLGFIRIFLKPQGEKADLKEPLVLNYGASVGDVCLKLHRDFINKFRYAVVWGESVKHAGQRVGVNHVLADGDVLSIIKKN